MDFVTQFGLLSVGIIISAIAILGFVVFFNDPKSSTNKNFLSFCLLTIAWGTLNYLSYRISDPKISFWLLRFSIFSAVWHVFFLFKLLYSFPESHIDLPKSYNRALVPVVIITAITTLTPFVFKQVTETSDSGKILSVTNGPGIILFAIVILAFVISSIAVFVQKVIKGNPELKVQLRPTLWGIILTFSLIIIFNFIFPAFLNNAKFISLGALFIFPFILGTSYSIFKHKLLNVKVISTEVLTFLLALVILIEMITSDSVSTLIFRGTIFLLVIITGILLIRSVRNEVQQREQLQVLTTELAGANEKLKALDLARAEFISIASHQLRTPPATVKWYLSAVLAGDYGKVSKSLAEPLKKTEQTNNHLISLIEDMLNVSRIERGKMEFLFELTNVEELAKFAYEQLIPQATNKKLQLTYLPPKSPLPQVMADKEKLRQVMNNLIDNAIKYTKEGFIEVAISRIGGDIHFQVRDSGKGINMEEQSAIFQKYSRGKESIKQSAGLGLGLYVAKIIIDQHKGKIWAESAGTGKGSTFMWSIPIQNDLKLTTLVDFAPVPSLPPVS